MNKRLAVAVVDGREWFDDIDTEYAHEKHAFAARALDGLKITTPWHDPQSLTVKVYWLVSKRGEQERELAATFEIQPRVTVPTDSEVEEHLRTMYLELPDSFHSFVSQMAHDRASGNDEVISYARSIIECLKPAVQHFEIECRSKKKGRVK